MGSSTRLVRSDDPPLALGGLTIHHLRWVCFSAARAAMPRKVEPSQGGLTKTRTRGAREEALDPYEVGTRGGRNRREAWERAHWLCLHEQEEKNPSMILRLGEPHGHTQSKNVLLKVDEDVATHMAFAWLCFLVNHKHIVVEMGFCMTFEKSKENHDVTAR